MISGVMKIDIEVILGDEVAGTLNIPDITITYLPIIVNAQYGIQFDVISKPNINKYACDASY